MVLLLFLLVEFGLGLGVNLAYSTIPSSVSAFLMGSGPSQYPIAVAHIAIGYLLGLLAIILTLLLWRKGTGMGVTLSLLGLVGIFGAGAAGDEFVVTGNNAFSLLMLIAFVFSMAMFMQVERKTRPSRARTIASPASASAV